MARYATFISPDLRLNLVLLVNDSDKLLDTYSLHRIGLDVADPASIAAAARAAAA